MTTTRPNQALLIIDVQQALCEGPYAAHDAQGLITRINGVAAAARRHAVPVFVIQHESSGPTLARGSAGWQLARGLEVLPGDRILPKTASDSFHRTDLQAQLQALGVERLIVTGMQSDFCVDTTVRRALALGYPVTLVSDGHSTCDNEVLSAPQIIAHHNHTLANISSFGVGVTLVKADAHAV